MYRILIGNYGSGKTELALNFALKSASAGKRTVLVDLDIVNPYFRSAEKTKLLTDAGAEVIAPPYAMTGVDLPVVAAEVTRVFYVDYDEVVFDVGGDAVGATALGRFSENFSKVKNNSVTYFVVNTRRPLAHSREDLLKMTDTIERASRMDISAFINNTNLASETTGEVLLEGEKILLPLADELGKPIAYTSGTARVLNEYSALKPEGPQGEFLEIELFMRPAWLDF